MDIWFWKISNFIKTQYSSIQLLNGLTPPFSLTYSLSPFLFITFLTLNSVWFVLQFVFIKRPNNLFHVKIRNNICSRHSLFIFLNCRNFFKPIWKVKFCKNIFVFWYLSWSSTSNLGSCLYFLHQNQQICLSLHQLASF